MQGARRRSGWGLFVRCVLLLGCLALPGCSGCQPQSTSDARSAAHETTDEPPPSSSPEPDAPFNEEASSVQESKPGESSPDAAESSAVDGEAGVPAAAPGDANAAWEDAKKLKESAAAAGKRGDYGRAFELTTQAWSNARKFPHDRRLAELANQLAAESEHWGDQANLKASDSVDNSPAVLIEK